MPRDAEPISRASVENSKSSAKSADTGAQRGLKESVNTLRVPGKRWTIQQSHRVHEQFQRPSGSVPQNRDTSLQRFEFHGCMRWSTSSKNRAALFNNLLARGGFVFRQSYSGRCVHAFTSRIGRLKSRSARRK